MEQEIENFLKELKNQTYLPSISYHYAKSLYEVISDKNTDLSPSDVKIMLMMSVLLELARNFGDICIQLKDSGTDKSNVINLVKNRTFEELVKNNLKLKKQFLSVIPNDSVNSDGFLRNWFDSFWAPLVEFDKNGTDGYLTLFRKFDSICGLYNKKEDAMKNGFNIPIVCYPADDSPCLYYSRYFYYETKVMELIGEKTKPNSGLMVKYFNDFISHNNIRPQDLESCVGISNEKKFEVLMKELLDILFPITEDSIQLQDQTLKELLLDPNCSKPDSDNISENLYPFKNIENLDTELTEIKNDPQLINWQKIAAASACLTDFTVITGGPGTGKTTTVAKILILLYSLSLINEQVSDHNCLRVCLAAPTGKAANRMKESLEKSMGNDEIQQIIKNMSSKIAELEFGFDEPITGNNSIAQNEKLKNLCSENVCFTIHKLIGMKMDNKNPSFNEFNQLPYDVVIVDEVSMMDLRLLTRLLLALKPSCKLIFLGDQEQLPSVEAGAILSDICLAYKFDCARDSKQEQHNLVKRLVAITGFKTLALFTNDVSLYVSKLFRSYRFADAKGIGKLASDINKSSLQGNLETLDYYERLENDKGERIFKFTVNIINYHSDCKEEQNKAYKRNHKPEDLIIRRILNQSCNFDNIYNEMPTDVEEFSYLPYFKMVRKLIGHPIKQQPTGKIINLADDKLAAADLFKTFNQFRILCTNRGNALGVESINQAIQKEVLKWYSRSKNLKDLQNSKETWGEYWYPGKPIMITKNTYHLGLFNGDIGITLFSPNSENFDKPEMKVVFQMPDGSYKYFATAELTNYELAYALTVHKSQGSEFDHTVVVLPEYDSCFVTKELLYTGITRAKSFVTLYGNEKEIIEYSEKQNQRTSNLAARLKMQF